LQKQTTHTKNHITGNWKLAGFTFAASTEYGGEGSGPFDYSGPALFTRLDMGLQPPLAYAAPETVAGASIGASLYGQQQQQQRAMAPADIFSLGLFACEMLTGRQLLPSNCDVQEYIRLLLSLQAAADAASAPPAISTTLRQMLSPSPEGRPPAAAFSASQFFATDVELRALLFLQNAASKGMAEKAAFLRDLPRICQSLDDGVLVRKVLPPLLLELRTSELQAAALPIVLSLVGRQAPDEFEAVALPALRPLVASATGELLALLARSAGALAAAAPPRASADLVTSILVRAMSPDPAVGAGPACQEEALRQTATLAPSIDYGALKDRLLPACRQSCLSTTSAAVRVAAFRVMVAAAARTGVDEAEASLALAAHVVAVDKSPATAMCVVALGEALSKQWGAKLAAEKALPAVAPLLVLRTLGEQQFGVVIRAAKEMLAVIERGRGGGKGGDGGGVVAEAARPASGAGRAAEQGPSTDGGGKTDWLSATTTGPTPTRLANHAAAPARDASVPFFPGAATTGAAVGVAGRPPPALPSPSLQPAPIMDPGLASLADSIFGSGPSSSRPPARFPTAPTSRRKEASAVAAGSSVPLNTQGLKGVASLGAVPKLESSEFGAFEFAGPSASPAAPPVAVTGYGHLQPLSGDLFGWAVPTPSVLPPSPKWDAIGGGGAPMRPAGSQGVKGGALAGDPFAGLQNGGGSGAADPFGPFVAPPPRDSNSLI
jgi:hypothetical protein